MPKQLAACASRIGRGTPAPIGVLLADRLTPPTWTALDIGISRPPTPAAPAMVNLGYVLTDLWDPPDLDGAQLWSVRNLVIDLRDLGRGEQEIAYELDSMSADDD